VFILSVARVRMLSLVLSLVFLFLVPHSAEEQGCLISINECPRYPHMSNLQFRDSEGETALNTGSNEPACLLRAGDYHNFCDSSRTETPQVSASFTATGNTNFFNPQSCDPGWLPFNNACYAYFNEPKSFYEANQICANLGSSLVSIHSDLENAFVAHITNYQSAWLGYVDLKKDEKEPENFQWTDNSQSDFTNWALDCEKTPNIPECAPIERQQQWYDAKPENPAVFVCKKSAKIPNNLIKVETAKLKDRLWMLESLKTSGDIQALKFSEL
jgi:Lectin C-type domain